MKDITLYDNILFPIDFSEDSNQNYPKALELATENNSELTILYAFRLIKEEGNSNDVIELKYRVESQAKQKFANLSSALQNSSKVNTSFLCEIGFLSDRIIATATTKNIDLLLISKSVAEILNKEMKNYRELFTNSLSCKVIYLS